MAKTKKATPAPKSSPLGDVRQMAERFKLVSDAGRLSIILALDEGSKNVGELCTALGGISQPAVSHHLAILRHSGAVEGVRDGKNVVYSLSIVGKTLAALTTTLVPV